MAFLLGTEAFITILQPAPESHPVIRWKRTVPNHQVFVSVISIGEVIDAYARLPAGQSMIRAAWERRVREQVPGAFFGRILDVDQRTAEIWALLRAAASPRLSTEDALLLATARAHGHVYIGTRPPGSAHLDVVCLDPLSLAVELPDHGMLAQDQRGS